MIQLDTNKRIMEEFSRSKIRKEAREIIKGNFLSLFAANLLVQILLGLSILAKDYIYVSIIIIIFTCVFEFGLAMFYIDYIKTKELDYKNLFISYFGGIKRFIRHLITFIIKYLIILLSASFLLIPGLIKRYSYSQVKYLRANNQEYGIIKCLLVSKRLMRWHKMELFLLDLTFVIWFLLIPLTGGLILIYFLPYYSAVMAKYHLYVKSRYDINKDINKSIKYYFIKYLSKMN